MTTPGKTVTIAGRPVPLVYQNPSDEEHHDGVIGFQPFREWLQAFSDEQTKRQGEVVVKELKIQSLDIFGSGKIGFLKFKADVELVETGKKLPGIVFLRGGAVGILFVLRSIDPKSNGAVEHVLLTTQARIPVPSLSFPELPAGMLDGSGNFAGIAAQEIEEETGFKIKESELTDLTALTYSDRWRGVYPSAGGSDEFLRLFLCTKEIGHGKLESLQGKLTGLRDHGEVITLKVVPLNDVWREAPDAKVLSALALLDGLRKAGERI